MTLNNFCILNFENKLVIQNKFSDHITAYLEMRVLSKFKTNDDTENKK